MAIDPVATCRYLSIPVGSTGRIGSTGSTGLEDEDEDEDEDEQERSTTNPKSKIPHLAGLSRGCQVGIILR